MLAAHRALAAVEATSRRAVFCALRAVLCARREDLAVFQAAFLATFGAEPGPAGIESLLAAGTLALPRAPRIPPPPAGGAEEPGGEPEPRPAAWSDVELLKEKDFAAYSDAERARARALIARLGARSAMRPSRRTHPSRRRARGARPDSRATLRAALRYGGEPVERRFRVPGTRPRPLVLVCDVSGSMEPYARMLLQYLQACVSARRRVEAFAFGTRLTRITPELSGRDPDRALTRAASAVADWHGGTRIGPALSELNRTHGRRVGRGADVVILSDGWDRGAPEELAAELARLSRCAHRVVWLNPLKARAGYEPLTRGMLAAMPHLDAFLAGSTIHSLEALAALLETGA